VRFAQGKRARLRGNGRSGFANKDLHNPTFAFGYAAAQSQKSGLGQGQKATVSALQFLVSKAYAAAVKAIDSTSRAFRSAA
jgi:hypothetical protein